MNPANPSNMPIAERGQIQPAQAPGSQFMPAVEWNGRHPISEQLNALQAQVSRLNKLLFTPNTTSNSSGVVQHIPTYDETLIREGILIDDLDKAANPKSGAKSAAMRVGQTYGPRMAGGKIMFMTDEKLRVVNRSTGFEASAGDHIMVVFHNGEWRPMSGGGGGGGSIIRFQVSTVDCELRVAECAVIAVPCGGGDVEVGDGIDVWDKIGCFFDVNPIFLQGVQGYATYMQNPEASATPYGYEDDCIWEVISLCASVSSCGPAE